MPLHSPLLRYFHEASRSGSMRSAARKLNVSPSAINRQIIGLENDLGVRLFERTPRGLALTDAGRVLADHIERTLGDAEATLRNIKRLMNQTRSVAIAGPEGCIADFLPSVLAEFHAEWRSVSTVFNVCTVATANRLLTGGEVDIALVFDPEPDAGVKIVGSKVLRVGAVMTPDHPLARRDQVTLAQCLRYPLILPDHTWSLRPKLDRALEGADARIEILTSSGSVELMRHLVRGKLGIGFQTMVGLRPRIRSGELVHVPLTAPPLAQRFSAAVARSHPLSEAAQRLTDLVLRRLEEY